MLVKTFINSINIAGEKMHVQKQDLHDPWKRECKNRKSEKCPGAPKLGWIASVFLLLDKTSLKDPYAPSLSPGLKFSDK